MDEVKIVAAKKAYDALLTEINRRGWHAERDDEKLIATLNVKGEDLPMRITIGIDVDRQLARVVSFMPFNMSKEKLLEGAIAAAVATYRLADGSFAYNISTGEIRFKLNAAFMDSQVGPELFAYMIDCACVVIDEFNDKFFMLDKGIIDIAKFING